MKLKTLVLLPSLLFLAFGASLGQAQESNLEERLAAMEKNAQTARDVQEIQNVMAMHSYYHAANMHTEEIDNIWAHKTEGVAFEEPGNKRYVGIDLIRKLYDRGHHDRGLSQMKMMHKLYPDKVADDPKNAFVGKMVIHTLTTHCIEVAGDGKTAKGIWVAPGILSVAAGDKLRANWHYDKYGVDFVKEDGKWKIWHLHVFPVFMAPYEKSWVENALHPQNRGMGKNEKLPADYPKPNAPSTAPDYEAYNPFKVAQFEPRPPVPYETFSETFSY